MTWTPTTLQPFTNLLLAELRRLDLLDKNKEVARRCNEALGKAGYILGPQLYRVGGAVPEDGWSSEGKKRAITVTSRTVTRWKHGVIPVGAHLEAVGVALFEGGISATTAGALTMQEAFQVMLRFGVPAEEITPATFDEYVALGFRYADITQKYGLPIDYLFCAFARSAPFEFGWDVRMWAPPTPARAEHVVNEVEAKYARAGKAPPSGMAGWIHRLMALEWCRRHGAHVDPIFDAGIFIIDPIMSFIREN